MTDPGSVPPPTSSKSWLHPIRRIGSNAIQLAIGRLSAQVILFFFTILIARRMDEEGLGAYAFMAAIVLIGNVFTTFGTDTLIMREVAANRDFSHLMPSLFLQLGLSGLYVSGVFLIATFFPGGSFHDTLALIVYCCSLFPMALYSVASAVLRGMELMSWFVGISLILAGTQTLLAWWFIEPGSSLLELSLILLSVQIMAAVFAGIVVLRKIPEINTGWKNTKISLPILLGSVIPLAAIAATKILFQKLTVLLLGFMEGAAITGWYSAAGRIIEAAQIGHVAALGALFPIMSYTYVKGRTISIQSKRLLHRSFWILLFLGFAATLLLFFLAHPLVNWAFGSEFDPSIQALRILAWLMIPYSINIYLSTSLISVRQERGILIVFLFSLLGLLLFNLWWISIWGLIGACLATLTAETIQAGLFIYLWYGYSRKNLSIIKTRYTEE